MIARRTGVWLFLALGAVVAIATTLSPRFDLPPSYHHFADSRGWLGLRNFGNVFSNVVFLIAGLWGLGFLASRASRQRFVDPRERWPYVLVFIGLVWTAFGSGYYHLAPDNDRLVWDRLPMVIVFMPLVAAQVAERVSVKLGLWVLPILTAVGVASVLEWHATVQHGAGDLRFYSAVQAYAVLALIVAMLLPARYTRNSDLIWVVAFYVVAKVVEAADHQIFSLGQIVSGHTVKHLSAGVAGLWVVNMLRKREAIGHERDEQ
jgi:hypothetical protein